LAQKSDLEDRVSILEKKYQQVQRDFLSAKDDNERLENELNSKESSALQVYYTCEFIYHQGSVVRKPHSAIHCMIVDLGYKDFQPL
jgi:hypothetical protein